MTNLIETYANAANTTLNGSINDSVQSLTVTSATGFPSYGQYRILIDAEIMIVTGGQGTTTWTVTRGVENSTISGHNNGASVRFVITAASLLELQWKDKIIVPMSGIHALDDEFDDGILDSSWIRVDNGADAANVTWTEAGDVLSMKNIGADAGSRYHALLKPLGGRSFPITIEIASRHWSAYAYRWFMFGVGFSDGTTYGAGKQIQTRPYTYNEIATSLRLSITSNTNFNTELTAWGEVNYQTIGGPFFHRLIWSATNTFQAWFSPDGVSWIQVGTNMSYSMTPTHVGIFTSNWGWQYGSSFNIGTVEYFRVFESDKAGNP